jgi:hypothetical protein
LSVTPVEPVVPNAYAKPQLNIGKYTRLSNEGILERHAISSHSTFCTRAMQFVGDLKKRLCLHRQNRQKGKGRQAIFSFAGRSLFFT